MTLAARKRRECNGRTDNAREGGVAPAETVGGGDSLTIRSIVVSECEPLRGAGDSRPGTPTRTGFRVGGASAGSRNRQREGDSGSGPLSPPVRPVRFLNPLVEGAGVGGLARPRRTLSKGLILAQNERWRRGLGMQVERAARPVAEG